jgi:hypothetical protein
VPSVKDGPCPGKFYNITREQDKNEGSDKPLLPIASFSPRQSLLPKVMFVPLLGVETRKETHVLYMLVVQIGVVLHPSVRAGARMLGKAWENGSNDSGVCARFALNTVMSSDHDYVTFFFFFLLVSVRLGVQNPRSWNVMQCLYLCYHPHN